MASIDNKAKKNVAGKYYVDQGCISCGQCMDIAKDFFAEDSENSGFYVCKQPVTDSEIAICAEAMKACPVESIGDDGK